MRAFFVGIFVCLSVHLCAQREIRGVVSNAESEPVAYASVVEVGTQNGTYTNDEGRFVLEISDTADSLEISFMGYITQLVDIRNKESLEIVLQTDAVVLSSVVVTIPYGMQKKKLLRVLYLPSRPMICKLLHILLSNAVYKVLLRV